jgi:rhamnogalacturonyl hydrolase YesR
MVLHVVARDKLWRLIKWGYKMGRLYDIVSRLLSDLDKKEVLKSCIDYFDNTISYKRLIL